MLEIIFGGLTGLIGTIWNSYNNRKIKELDIKDKEAARAHDLKMVEAETQAMIEESKASIRITSAKVEGTIELEEVKAYGTAQRVGNKNVFASVFMEKLFQATGPVAWVAHPVGVLVCLLFGIVDTVKGLARPAITVYLLAVSTWVTMKAWELAQQIQYQFSAMEAIGLLSSILSTVLYLTTTSVTWWFGDRMVAKGAERIWGRK